MCCALDRDNREVAKFKVHEAKQVLDQWKLSYFEMRAEIEESGRDRRWEFDRKRLFERTDYMASVCQDLYNVLQVSVHTLHKFLPLTQYLRFPEGVPPDLYFVDFGGVL